MADLKFFDRGLAATESPRSKTPKTVPTAYVEGNVLRPLEDLTNKVGKLKAFRDAPVITSAYQTLRNCNQTIKDEMANEVPAPEAPSHEDNNQSTPTPSF